MPPSTMRKMRRTKLLFHLAGILLFTFACGAKPSLTPPSVNLESKMLIDEPPAAPLVEFDPLPTPPFLVPTPTTFPYPEWVTDFSDPILAALANQNPGFHDEFPFVCIYNFQRMDECPRPEEMLNYIDGLSILNQGWFYRFPDSTSGPYYSDMQDEALFLRSSEGKDDRDVMIYNPRLIRENFVLRFDFQFRKTQPEDVAQIQFVQTGDESVFLDISKNKNWSLSSPRQAVSGTFEYFPPERINVIIIMQGSECAVYFNDAPLGYLGGCRSAAVTGPYPWAVSFRMISTTKHAASAVIDNVRLWDLDEIPGLR